MNLWLQYPLFHDLWNELSAPASLQGDRLYYLRGKKDFGKRFFYEHLRDALFELPRDIVWIRPPKLMDDDFSFSLLSSSMEASNNRLSRRVTAFAQHCLTGLNKEEAYDQWLGFWAEHFWSSEQASENRVAVFFVLDDYDMWPNSWKEWFSLRVVHGFVSQMGPECFYFLSSGEKRWDNSFDLDDYWKGYADRCQELVMTEITERQLHECAQGAGLEDGVAGAVLEQTQGAPGKALRLLAQYAEEKRAEIPHDKKAFFEALPEDELSMLSILAHCGQINQETVSLVQTERSKEDVFRYLKTVSVLAVQRKDGVCSLLKEDQECFLLWQEQYRPDLFAADTARVGHYQSIIQIIPHVQDRMYLARLGELIFFNEKMIREAFADEGDMLWHFVETHPEYTQRTQANYKLCPYVHQAITDYMKIFGIRMPSKVRQAALDLWELRKNELYAAIKKKESFLKQNKAEEEDNGEEISSVAKQVKEAEQRFEKQFKEKAYQSSMPKVEDSSGSPVFAVVFFLVGIVLLYAGVIFSRPVSWSYVVVSFFFMGLGAICSSAFRYTPRLVAKVNVDYVAMKSNMREDPLLKLLYLKQESLHMRKRHVQKSTTDLELSLKALDISLNEPYL